ncbi:MarR family winged helix-turn-helix transcriptional regulator [Mycobacterium sp. C31M]
MVERIPELELDNQLCFVLYRASRAMTRAYGPCLAELGITYPQYLTMMVLWEADEPLFVSEIGDQLHLDSGTLTPLLKRLQDQGFIDRKRDADDERRVRIGLTRAGRELRRAATIVPQKMARQYDLTPAAIRELMAELGELADMLEGTTPALE